MLNNMLLIRLLVIETVLSHIWDVKKKTNLRGESRFHFKGFCLSVLKTSAKMNSIFGGLKPGMFCNLHLLIIIIIIQGEKDVTLGYCQPNACYKFVLPYRFWSRDVISQLREWSDINVLKSLQLVSFFFSPLPGHCWFHCEPILSVRILTWANWKTGIRLRLIVWTSSYSNHITIFKIIPVYCWSDVFIRKKNPSNSCYDCSGRICRTVDTATC